MALVSRCHRLQRRTVRCGEWLDQRIRDQALVVIAVHMAPRMIEDSVEAAVGLLFGNRLTQTNLDPCPEHERSASNGDLNFATLGLGGCLVDRRPPQTSNGREYGAAPTGDVGAASSGPLQPR